MRKKPAEKSVRGSASEDSREEEKAAEEETRRKCLLSKKQILKFGEVADWFGAPPGTQLGSRPRRFESVLSARFHYFFCSFDSVYRLFKINYLLFSISIL